MIADKIEAMELEFCHYPAISRRKNPYGPVLCYKRKNHFLRVDVRASKWIVRGEIRRKALAPEKFDDFPSAYARVKEIIYINRLRLFFR